MVFGWGKKKPEEAQIRPAETVRHIGLDEINSILGDLQKVRAKTLVAETGSIRNRIEPQLRELYEIAIMLAEDDLKIDDIDKHLKTIVERGKKQVISIIKEDAGAKIPDIKNTDDVEALNSQINRSLKRMGDVLGRQSRVIHLFAKKYAGKMKTILANLQEDKNTIQSSINSYKEMQASIRKITNNVTEIGRSKKTLEKRTKRISEIGKALHDLDEEAKNIEYEINDIKKSDEYSGYLLVQEQINDMEPRRHDLAQGINDQFTKISRPLGKYEYVSALDKEQKRLLNTLVNSPFDALASERRDDIMTILQSVKKGVISGSVSVKDTEKSAQLLDETSEMLDSMISKKDEFSNDKKILHDKLSSFDVGHLKDRQADLEKNSWNRNDMRSKIKQFEDEISETKRRIPRLITDTEFALREISSTRYAIKAEDS